MSRTAVCEQIFELPRNKHQINKPSQEDLLMANKALFQELIYDEAGNLVETAVVGQEMFYVIDDAGFKRHIDADQVDRQVLQHLFGAARSEQGCCRGAGLKNDGQRRSVYKSGRRRPNQQY